MKRNPAVSSFFFDFVQTDKTDMSKLIDAFLQLFVANVRKSTETYLSILAFVPLLIYLKFFLGYSEFFAD